MNNPRILIACEESQAVTIAFRERGFEAFSCDIEECSGGHPEWHIKKDVLGVINYGWDAMVAFPPCTYLSNVGNGWFSEERYGEKARVRKRKRIEAYKFFLKLWDCGIPHIAIENPQGYINSHLQHIPEQKQRIHPYYFGDPEMKRTYLWLRGLPPLTYRLEKNLFGDRTATDKPEPKGYHKNGRQKGKPIYFTESHGFTPERAKVRSKTFPGIAAAMAEQWGEFLFKKLRR